jgi:hypothetical protein
MSQNSPSRKLEISNSLKWICQIRLSILCNCHGKHGFIIKLDFRWVERFDSLPARQGSNIQSLPFNENCRLASGKRASIWCSHMELIFSLNSQMQNGNISNLSFRGASQRFCERAVVFFHKLLSNHAPELFYISRWPRSVPQIANYRLTSCLKLSKSVEFEQLIFT